MTFYCGTVKPQYNCDWNDWCNGWQPSVPTCPVIDNCDDCGDSATKIDFNDLSKGTIVSDQFAGVTISSLITRKVNLTVEAEDMHRSRGDFTEVDGRRASGGDLVKLKDDSGTLSTAFKGADGVYDIKVSVQDECDGQSEIDVVVNGCVVATITLDRDNNGWGSDDGHFSTFTIEDVFIAKGQSFQLVARRDGHEQVRIDKVSFHGEVTENRAMIFDTNHITGGDHDLRNGDGKVLIISEDGDKTDPDDEADGGAITFDFDEPSTVTKLTVIDTEEGGKIEAFDENGVKIGEVAIPRIRDSEVRCLDLNFTGVAKLVVTLNGSGAIDDLCFETPVVDPMTASLGNFVFFDENENGVFDNIDTVVEGVTVELLSATGVVLGTDTTDANGLYLFDNLAAGDYRVRFVAPTGLAFTAASAAAADAVNNDSDADLTTGETGLITLEIGEAERDVDAGLIQPNRAPVADDEAAKLCADASVTIDVLAGDTDADGDVLSIVNIISGGDVLAFVGGSVTLASGAVVQLVDGKLVYDVSGAGDAFDALEIGETAVDAFQYTVIDGEGGVTIADVAIDLCGALNTIESISARLPEAAVIDINLITSGRTTVGAEVTVDFIGRDDLDGVYDGFCIELPDALNSAANLSANVYSSYEPLPDRLITDPGADIDKPENLDLVNYVLNLDRVNSDLPDQFAFNAVQDAVWALITDEKNPATLTGDALAIYQDAIANGEGYRPGEGDVLGLILEPVNAAGVDNGQVFIVAVPFETLSEDCLCL